MGCQASKQFAGQQGMPGFYSLLPTEYWEHAWLSLSAALLFPQNKDVFLLVKLSWRHGWTKEGIALFT